MPKEKKNTPNISYNQASQPKNLLSTIGVSIRASVSSSCRVEVGVFDYMVQPKLDLSNNHVMILQP